MSKQPAPKFQAESSDDYESSYASVAETEALIESRAEVVNLNRQITHQALLWICRLLSFCLNFLFVSPIFPQYRFENWSTEQGLPYKTVRGVLQTRDGYIWAATSDGLARFDGVRFTVFNTANSPGLKTNRLDDRAEILVGSLWLSGEEGLLFQSLIAC